MPAARWPTTKRRPATTVQKTMTAWPQTVTAWLEPTGELVVNSSTQGPFATRDSLAGLLGRPADTIRVRAAPLHRLKLQPSADLP